LATTVAACTSSSGGDTGGHTGANSSYPNSNGVSAPGAKTGTFTVAEQPNLQPNWILPFPDPTHLSPTNLPWYEMTYRPLYWFGKNGKTVLNTDKSLAEPPKYSSDRKTVTIKMKPWKWSNGKPITAKNVMFWINMAKANKDKLGIYTPGYIPDNIVSAKVSSPETLVLHLDKAYNEQWFTFSQLSQMWVFPENWDVTGKGQRASCSTSQSSCKAVYQYLYSQAKDEKSYATNSLWRNVDGPWKIAHFDAQGHITMVPNKNYSGPDKPQVNKYVMMPFTDTSAEYNALKSGKTLDAGYIPFNAISQPRPDNAGVYGAGPTPVSDDYNVVAGFQGYGPSYIELDNNDPKMGPVFKQQYFRQALESTIDQEGIIKSLFHNYGVPNYGPVPLHPSSPWIPSIEKGKNPYPFDLDKAKQLLTDNGWKVNPGGTSVCAKPGTGQGQCGKGIKKGQKLSFQFIYFSGDVTTKTLVSSYKSSASKVGINLQLNPQPFQAVQQKVHPCAPAQCQWQAEQGAWFYVYYPSGEQAFHTGAFANFGSYSDPEIDKLIDASHTKANNQAMLDYATAAAKKLPGVWTPTQQILSAYAKGVKGYPTQAPYSFPFASQLYFDK
jgi:peptide/nickel transport system substrate-binding protein